MTNLFVGLDVSKEETAICIRREDGSIVQTAKTATDPIAILTVLEAVSGEVVRVVLETGRMANWLFQGLQARGLPVACIDARQAHAVMSQMHNKTDANDAAMLAELARTGFYRKIAVKSRSAQEKRAFLRAREVAPKARLNVENTIRGLLASFGLRLPRQPRTFAGRVMAALELDEAVAVIVRPLLHLRAEILESVANLDRELRHRTRDNEVCRRLMTTPGIGAISAFAFVATIDDPARFRNSRAVGAYVGLTAKRHQSGERDPSGRITKRGDRLLRTVLYEAANALLTRVHPGAGADLQAWGRRLRERIGHKKAVVALARKLAVLLHRLWCDGTVFAARAA